MSFVCFLGTILFHTAEPFKTQCWKFSRVSKRGALAIGYPRGVTSGVEWIELIVEILFGLLDVGTLLADLYSWVKGKENRVQRRAARKTGNTPPPRDKWNRRVIILTLTFVILTTLLIAWKR